IANECTRFWNSGAKRRPGGQTMKRVDRDLHANRRLNIEITPALAEGQSGLRNQDIVRDAGPITAGNGHLEEAGHNVISVLLIGGMDPLFHKEGRQISSRGWGALRPGGRDSRRCRKNDFGIVSRDELHSCPTRPAAAQQALRIALGTRAVLLVIEVPAKL